MKGGFWIEKEQNDDRGVPDSGDYYVFLHIPVSDSPDGGNELLQN